MVVSCPGNLLKSLTFYLFNRNDTGSCLRMKISAIPVGPNATTAVAAAAAAARTNNNNKIDLQTNNYHHHQYGTTTEKMTQPKHSAFSNVMQKKRRDSSTNSSFCSDCTGSDDSDSSLPSGKNQQRSRKASATSKRKPQKNGMVAGIKLARERFIDHEIVIIF